MGKRKMVENNIEDKKDDTRSYFTWNLEMERVLADSHEEARRFRFKVIPNWDDIVDLCAKDRATGTGAENALDADDIMSKEEN
ncbi:hypothetical protein SESBI_13037 [Sesbania bispinosa]|nr:hypothetical protein SESBI_13037 [Sesbania bispinosa]